MCKTFNVCAPLGLMSHLKVMGGVYSEKANRKMVERPMKCKFHYGTRMFLYYLYKDYHGGESMPNCYDSQCLSYHFTN